MESKKINQLATELAPDLSDLTIIGDPITGISKKITLSQMASLFTGTVEEYANLAAFPLVGVADTIYIALDTNILYRWNTGTSAYVELSPNIVSSLVFNDANGFDGTINLVGSVATLTITTALTTGSVGFIGASGALLQDNANFFWDDTNNRLGIGTNAPTTALDVFGSGIIGRINGTSTNNAFLGFASAGTNKWSIGNVQSDHRFRIYSEANTAELVSVLQTGEFGIGIANPTTKFHIDGAASALIANLDANVSVAKSISFRSDNSNRINLEVSGTESGSNAGANFFIRRYSDAGSLIDTPLTITRSTGAISLATALSGTSATFTGNLFLSGTYADFQNTSYIRFSNSGGGTRWGYIQHNGTDISFSNDISGGKFTFDKATEFSNSITVKSGNNAIFYRADNAIYTTLNDAGSGSANGFILNNTNGEGFHFKNGASTIMRMNSSNNVLIGTTSDNGTGKLQVINSSAGWGGQVSNSNGQQVLFAHGGGFGININAGSNASASTYIIDAISNSTTRFFVQGDGKVGIGTNAPSYQLQLTTDSAAKPSTNTWTISSDIRVKENINPYTKGLETILKINPVTYDYNGKAGFKKIKENIGIIAQDVLDILPESISTYKVKLNDNDNEESELYNFNSHALTYVLINAIKEQQVQIEKLKQKIK